MQIKYIYYAAKMRFTRHTDYVLRVLMHLALEEDRLCSIGEIARAHGISHNHLTKVVVGLTRQGVVATVRGRAGGLRLARPAGEIGVGAVVRGTEEGFELADCPGCLLVPACGLTGVLAEASAALLAVLDRYTIADLVGPQREAMRQLIESAAG